MKFGRVVVHMFIIIMFTWSFNKEEDEEEDKPRVPTPAVPLLKDVVVIQDDTDEELPPLLPPSASHRPLLPMLQNGARFQGLLGGGLPYDDIIMAAITAGIFSNGHTCSCKLCTHALYTLYTLYTL